MRKTRHPIVFFLSQFLSILVLGGVLSHASDSNHDAPWRFADSEHRVLVRLWASATGTPLARPVRISMSDSQLLAKATGFHAWDITDNKEVAVQSNGSEVVLDPSTVIAPGKERRYYLYIFSKPCVAKPVAQVDDTWQVETDGYIAHVNQQQGGAITSLLLKEGDRRTETLGNGIYWWTGRKAQITQKGFGALPIEKTANGPVFVGLRITYRDLLAKGNSLVTDYRFFKDFIEVDHHYNARQKARLEWLKIPVSLRAKGPTPGLSSNSLTTDAALLTSGASNKWTSDPSWHDVSYQREKPFGMGVIMRSQPGTSGLYFMDSVKADEFEWIYAEPFGWQQPQEIESDFDIKLTLVPHVAGKGRYLETLAKRETDTRVSVSVPQTKDGPPIDSDHDGLPDLAELERGTNPNCYDTDLDGVPDGQDSDPLRGPVPNIKVKLPAFKAQPTDRPQTLAQVKPVLGVPTLVLDGKPYGPMIYTRCAGTLDQLGEMANRNFPVHFEMVGGVGWPGDQTATFKRLDEQLNRFLNQVPNGRIILRLYVCNPPHFARDYPEETMAFNDGARNHFTKWYAMTDRPLEERGYPSFASEVWRQKTAEALHSYVTHVRKSDYAKNIIGYFVCGGGTEEWYYWGDYDHSKYAVDFSKPMLKAFRDYLRSKYDGDVRKLRVAWGEPQADFGTVLPPDPRSRQTTDDGVFWDPNKSQRVRDYYYVHNKVMEDSLLIFSRAVKQACNREQLMGMFHGYLQNHWYLEGGQATLRELLSSPDVDFWSGPPQYNRRGHGEHACIRFPIASLKKNGKLWISESDIRTNFSEPSPTNPSLYGRPPDLDETLACLKREFAHQLCEGGNGWWFQMGKSWYHHEPILSLFDQMQRCGEAAMSFNRTSDTDIAAVVSLNSLFTGRPWPVSSSLMDAFKVQETCRIGAPVDHYELSDILARDAKRYKLYLMINCFSLTDKERRLIDERLRRRGAVLVWMFAPGLFNPDKKPELSIAHIKSLLGFTLASQTGAQFKLNMKLTDAGAQYFSGFAPQRVFGSFERPEWVLDKATGGIKQQFPREIELPQRFQGVDGGEVLARFEDCGQPSIVKRQTASATDIWIGSVMAPADLLRSIAKRAGCHFFCDGDEIIYADRSFLAIHTREKGGRTFDLRRKADVIEVFSGDVLGRGVTRFKDTIDAYHTRLYFIGDGEKWTAQRKRADEVFSRFQQELKSLRQQRATQ
ncbi:MAG: hypothetical protein WA117_15595 [Verrucomicrobiia bacterium]